MRITEIQSLKSPMGIDISLPKGLPAHRVLWDCPECGFDNVTSLADHEGLHYSSANCEVPCIIRLWCESCDHRDEVQFYFDLAIRVAE